ncbi:MAG: MBOAT family O-acyltransferase, partial [bacterium]
IRTPVRFSGRGVALGLQVLLWGLVKKVVIADHLAVFVDATYGQAAFASPADLVIATYFFAFQLYCDFSGYSEMAIGAAKILGIDLMENFRRPYLSTSTPEFWSDRWHLSLATWFRDYMYIPMGGSRVPTLRKYGNVMAVFLVSGLWHGAAWTFVVWGGLNGLYHVLSVMTRKLRDGAASLLRIPGKVRHVWAIFVTFHLVLVTWVFFRADSLSAATSIYSRIWGSFGTLPGLLRTRVTTPEILYSVGLIVALMILEVFEEKAPLWKQLEEKPRVIRWAAYYAMILALVVLGSWGQQEFVYMQF